MLIYCWPTACDVGPAVNQHLFNISCLLVMIINRTTCTMWPAWINQLDHHVNGSDTRHIHPMLNQCRVTIVDGGPTLTQHWVGDTRLQGRLYHWLSWQHCNWQQLNIDNVIIFIVTINNYRNRRKLDQYTMAIVLDKSLSLRTRLLEFK